MNFLGVDGVHLDHVSISKAQVLVENEGEIADHAQEEYQETESQDPDHTVILVSGTLGVGGTTRKSKVSGYDYNWRQIQCLVSKGSIGTTYTTQNYY